MESAYNRSMERLEPLAYSQSGLADSQDSDPLRVLAIFHYLLAALTFLVACLFLVHLAVGAITMAQLSPDERSRLPVGFGSGFNSIGVIGLVGGWSLAALNALSAWCMSRRRLRGLSLGVSVLNLAWPPAGTGLGVITLITLGRPSVRELYAPPEREGAA